jgi:MoaA/NifB/PqqE/SkfB family radical SAM enzyme
MKEGSVVNNIEIIDKVSVWKYYMDVYMCRMCGRCRLCGLCGRCGTYLLHGAEML